MQTCADLRRHADGCLFANQHADALHAYHLLLQLQPTHVDARLRLADALLALGEVEAATTVYAAVARFATHAGYPFRALVAAELLRALSSKWSPLATQIAELYASDSPRLAQQGARVSLGNEDEPLPAGFQLPHAPALSTLVAQAAATGASLQTVESLWPSHLPAVPLFSSLPAPALAALFGCARLQRARARHRVFTQGSPADAFYVLARGVVRVGKADEGSTPAEASSVKLFAGTIFGEMALVRGTRRNATALCEQDCDLLCFDAEAMHTVQQTMPAIAQALGGFARDRALQQLLATSPLFSSFDTNQKQSLLRRFEAFEVEQGATILQQGQEGAGLYLLWHGDAQVSREEGGQDIKLALLHSGDLFGEISLLDDQPVTASVTAASPCSLLFLPRAAFQKLIDAFPRMRDSIERLKEDRQIDTCLALDDAFGAP